MSHSYQEIRGEPPESYSRVRAKWQRIRKSSAIYKPDLIGPFRFLEENPHSHGQRPLKTCLLAAKSVRFAVQRPTFR